MHIITKEWIKLNSTEKGAWTKKQIEAIGLDWPPTKGWIAKLVGKSISSLDARAFEDGKLEFKKERV